MTIKVKHSGKPTSDEMNALGALFNQDKLVEAGVLAVSMTQQYPKHVFGWKALGAVRKNQHRLQEAVDAFELAAQIAPKDAEVQHNLGNCYFDLGDDSKAVLHYQKAVKLEPDFALAYFNLASSLRRQNKFNDAEERYKKAIKLEPKNSLFCVKLADLYYEQKSFDDAIKYFQQAIKLAPDDAVLYVSLGASFKALLQYDDAKKAYENALKLNPDYALVYSNLADMYNEMGRFDEAEVNCRHAIQIAPEFAKAYSNLAMALQNLARFDEAIAAFHQALALDPTDIATLSNFSLMLIAHNQFTHAEAYQKRAIELNPNFVAAYINLAQNYIYQGRIDEAETCYLQALNIQPDNILAKSGLLFAMNYSAKYSLADRLTQANEYNDMVVGQVKTAFSSWLNTNPSKRLRVGMVSGDLRQHAVAYFLDNVLQYFDTSKIELIAYSTDAREDAMTARLRPYFSAWHSLVGLSNEDAAQKIHHDGIQVLIDLSGHSAGNRLPIFARKPAPVQVSWLGYFATTGLTAMDYFIADPVGVPAENHGHFVETIKYLPDTRLCFSIPDVDVAISPLPVLANQYITFGSFQNTAKVGDEVLLLWAQILKALPNARLRLQSKALGDAEVAAKILERLVNCGIDPNMVSMHGFISRQGYLQAHAEIDMILDTFPFNGGTTTCEALWMGVPTLTIAGDSLIARQGASMLTAAGLGDWVASNASDFVNKAISFARDINHLADLRAKLREQVVTSPLFDGKLFARNMEQALLDMWLECGRNVNEGEMKEPHVEVQYQPLTKEAYEQKLRDNFKRKVIVVSATRYSEDDFWYKSALGLSLQKQLRQDTRLSANIAFENSRGLSEVFNENIKLADDDAIMVFVHDDVWIDELNLADAVIQGLEHFDVIGVAGNKRRVPNQPAWPFIDTNFTWDERSNLSGRVAHGQQAFGAVSDFGDVPAACELMDGVFLAAKKSTLTANHVEFDPQFDFHFYDLDFCRTARQAGLRLGTWVVRLTHQSGGAFGSSGWVDKYQLYLNKWESSVDKDEELKSAMNDVLQLAIEHQQAGQLEQAEILYQEILKIQPEHAEANHNLGVIEAHSNDAATALIRLERAVQAQPENEQYWVSYVDALMQSGATESAIDALELGQQYGLKAETAQALAAEFTKELVSKNVANLELKVSNSSACHVYQIYYSEKTKLENDPGFLGLDNLDNARPDWREYWPIRNFLLNTKLNENDFYGFLSPKFKDKTDLVANDVYEFVKTNADEADVFLFSPFFDQGAFFLNLFEHASVAHQGIKEILQDTVSKIAPNVDFASLVMDSRNIIFCNYIVAKPSFWNAWLDSCELLFSEAEENNTSYAKILNADTNHDGGLAPNKVFVIERIASLLLSTQNHWRVKSYHPTELPFSNSPVAEYRRELIQMDDLKREYVLQGSTENLVMFMKIRRQIQNDMSIRKQPPLQVTFDEVFKMAMEHQNAGRMETAQQYYLEALRIQPRNADANHNFGVIEAGLLGAIYALPRFEIAVQEKPECEQFWVSYIDALMQSGAPNLAADAIELGHKYGLGKKMAAMLAVEFSHQLEVAAEDVQNGISDKSQNNAESAGMIATLIPAYKTEFLLELLECLASQTYKNFYVIISDDSPDGEVRKKLLSAEFSDVTEKLNLTIVDGPKTGKNHENIRHLLKVWNKHTDLLHFLFDDDVIYPTFYATHMLAHQKSTAQVSVSRRWHANSKGLPLDSQTIPVELSDINNKFVYIKQSDLAVSTIPNCNNWLGEYSNTIFKRSAVPILHELCIENISIYGLGDLASFIFAGDGILWINEHLGFFRSNSQQISGKTSNSSFKASHLAWVVLAIIAFNKKLIDFSGFQSSLAFMHQTIAINYFDDKEMLEFNSLIDVLRLNPDNTSAFLTMWDTFVNRNGFD